MAKLKDNYLSSSEAAKVLGIHPFTIQKLLRDGKLPADKIANRWLIRRQVAEEFAKTYVPRVGRPRKKRSISMTEAAEVLGVYRHTIRALVKRGLLTGDRIAGRLLLERDAVEELAKVYTPRVGRPSKKRRRRRVT